MKHKDDSLEWHDENELVRRIDVVEAVLNLADTLDDVIDVIMSVPTYTTDRKTEPKPCEWCKFYDGENCFSQEPCKVMLYLKTEPQTDIGTSDTVYSDTAGYVPRVDMTDCSWKKGE